MQKCKRFLAWLLAVLLVSGNIVMQPVMAADSTPVFEIGTCASLPGETIQIPVIVRSNPGIAAIKLKISYDTSRLELTDINYGNWSGNFQQPQKMDSPVSLTWYNGTENYTVADSVFATLTFRVLNTAQPGDANLEIAYDPNNVYNIAEQNIAFIIRNGKITIVSPEVCVHEEITDAYQPVGNGKHSHSLICDLCGEELSTTEDSCRDQNADLRCDFCNGELQPAKTPAFIIGDYTAQPGEVIQVPVQIKDNPGIAAVKLKVDYDDTRLNLTEITYGNWSGNFQQPQHLTSPVSLTWYNGTENYIVADSTFATLTFQVQDNAAAGEAAITISYDPNNVYNIAETNIYFAVQNGTIVISAPPACDHTSFTNDYESNSNGTHTRAVKCALCSEEIATSTEDCTYKNCVCTLCGYTRTHDWDQGTETTPPTCTTAGVMTYTCLNCGTTRTEEIPGPGHHNYQNGICTQCGALEDTMDSALVEVTINGITVKYADISEAVVSLANTTEESTAILRLLKNIELTEPLRLSDGIFTLDLNAYTIHYDNGVTINLTGMVNLTLIDSSSSQTGMILADGVSTLYEDNGIVLKDNAKLTMHSGTVKGSDTAIYTREAFATQVVITGGVLQSDNHSPIYAGSDVRILGGQIVRNGTGKHISHANGSVSFEGYVGDPTGISIGIFAYCDPVPSFESYHLPEGYCFYSYSSNGTIGSEPITELKSNTTLSQSYIIGRLPKEPAPDEPATWKCIITDNGAEIHFGLPFDNGQLLMAAYSSDGCMLAVTDAILTDSNGYTMFVDAIGIKTVRLFVLDANYAPITEALFFE